MKEAKARSPFWRPPTVITWTKERTDQVVWRYTLRPKSKRSVLSIEDMTCRDILDHGGRFWQIYDSFVIASVDADGGRNDDAQRPS